MKMGVVSKCLCEDDDNDDDQNHSTDHTQDDYFLPEREEQSRVRFNNNNTLGEKNSK